jgi:hypothetical protein
VNTRHQFAFVTLPTIVATATTIGSDTVGRSVAVTILLILASHLFTLFTHKSCKAFAVAIGFDTGDVAPASTIILGNAQLFITF